jgi:hypothetical protein
MLLLFVWNKKRDALGNSKGLTFIPISVTLNQIGQTDVRRDRQHGYITNVSYLTTDECRGEEGRGDVISNTSPLRIKNSVCGGNTSEAINTLRKKSSDLQWRKMKNRKRR